MAHNHTVSCTDQQEKLLKEKNISPSEAFQKGIMILVNEEVPFDPLISFEESKDAQIEKLKRALSVVQEELIKQTDKKEGII